MQALQTMVRHRRVQVMLDVIVDVVRKQESAYDEPIQTADGACVRAAVSGDDRSATAPLFMIPFSAALTDRLAQDVSDRLPL